MEVCIYYYEENSIIIRQCALFVWKDMTSTQNIRVHHQLANELVVRQVYPDTITFRLYSGCFLALCRRPYYVPSTRLLIPTSDIHFESVVYDAQSKCLSDDIGRYSGHSDRLKRTTKWTGILVLSAVWLQFPTFLVCSLCLICSSDV